MDFSKTPDFGDLPLNNPNTQAGGAFPTTPDFGSPAVTPTTISPTESTIQGFGDTQNVNQKQFIYTLLIALFITLVIGAITLFGVTTYLKAAEPPPTTGKYTFGNAVAPTQPAPTKVAPTIPAPTKTAAVTQLTTTPTPEPWRLVFRDSAFQLNSTGVTKIATISATLFGPAEKGTYVCSTINTSENQYFTYKKSDKVFERLCDSTLDKPEPQISCVKYNPELGVPISQTLYPRKDCVKGTIEAGKYVLFSSVTYNCNEAGTCTDGVDVYSPEMSVEQ